MSWWLFRNKYGLVPESNFYLIFHLQTSVLLKLAEACIHWPSYELLSQVREDWLYAYEILIGIMGNKV